MNAIMQLDPVEMHIAVIETALKDLARERNIYKAALEQIAGQESGGWGMIAHTALRLAKEQQQ